MDQRYTKKAVTLLRSTLMKILFISDIHGSASRANAVLSIARQENVDILAVLGDVMYHGPRNPLPEEYNPREVAAQLNSWKKTIVAVRGNCDSEVDQMLLNFPIMGDYAQIATPHGMLFLTHGHLWNGANLPNNKQGSVLIHGHTHIPCAETVNGTHIWNPGSCSLPKEGYQPSYGIYENGTFTVLTLDGTILFQQSIAAS